jgi:hypothetical protein
MPDHRGTRLTSPSGYLTDLPHLPTFNPGSAPALLDLVALLSGVEPPNRRDGFFWCEFGGIVTETRFERTMWSGRLATWPISRIADIASRLRSSSTRSGCISSSP